MRRPTVFLLLLVAGIGFQMEFVDSVQHNRIRVVFTHEYTDADDDEVSIALNQVQIKPVAAQQAEFSGSGVDKGKYLLLSNNIDSPTGEQTQSMDIASGGFVINTWGFLQATEKAWSTLAQNGSALDAVEVGCTECEVLQCDTTVGYGGSPDENGETTLDALIIDGTTHAIGAVGCLRRIKPAISVARKVMEHTRHSILVGELATHFALQMGFVEENLTTPVSAKMHADWKNATCQPNFWKNVDPDPTRFCGPYSISQKQSRTPGAGSGEASAAAPMRKIDRFNHDTIGMVVVDGSGAVASGTSSNGARNKIPGRVGDAAIVGAGTYADKDAGGAAATGDGDVMMRFLPSLITVEQMRMGRTPTQAAEYAIRRIAAVYPSFSGAIVALNLRGEYGAACHGMDRFPFSFRNGTLANAQEFSVNCV